MTNPNFACCGTCRYYTICTIEQYAKYNLPTLTQNTKHWQTPLEQIYRAFQHKVLVCTTLQCSYPASLYPVEYSLDPQLYFFFFPCTQGCFCAVGSVLLHENSSVCVAPENCEDSTTPDLCLPVLAISVPVKVVASGADLCTSQGRSETEFTQFLKTQIVRQYRSNAADCWLSGVKQTSCVSKFSFVAISYLCL